MIRSFADKQTEALFRDEVVRQFQSFVRPAKRKLEAINAASRLEDLKVPPANRLEKLKGRLEGFLLNSHQRSMASDLPMGRWRGSLRSHCGLPLKGDDDG
jgi:plasmid maintenance system killer protein